jgi:hypothetical protein
MFIFPFTKIILPPDDYVFKINQPLLKRLFIMGFRDQYDFLFDNDIEYDLLVDELTDDRDVVLFFKISLVIYDENDAALYKLFFHEIHS